MDTPTEEDPRMMTDVALTCIADTAHTIEEEIDWLRIPSGGLADSITKLRPNGK
jgi:hypothetical protein